MSAVLVLNATYEPLSVVSLRRAIVLLLKDKAEVIEAAQSRIRAESMSLPMPLVIRLVYFVRVPHRAGVPLTRRAVFVRDDGVCQYCGARPPRAEMTVDHVLPRVKGGITDWENVVCACQRCNTRKGSRTPEEANMPLRRPPFRPQYCAVVLLSHVSVHESWTKYIEPVPGGSIA
ncbi:MAG: HNH endonuclease [Chloroflexi bacterium]|nr:HNH endonuclease [Chloroflexota bacterium]